ncbi:hypothetical protein L9F63_009138, partial [Diploptera punctata]
LASNAGKVVSHCTVKCNTQLECGHTCLGIYCKCLHVHCHQNCARTLIHGHK